MWIDWLIIAFLTSALLWVLMKYFGLLQSSKQRGQLTKQYLVGLNQLLNEQPDKAIDTFINLLEVDSETVETHLALGNLFRKRGEVDRAIRIHQNLIARPALIGSYRQFALLELGYDYLAAGLFDRAEKIFKELSQDESHKVASLQQLMFLYQQTKDWAKGVEVVKKLEKVTSQSLDHVIAHYYCELAEVAMQQAEYKVAKDHLKKAIQADKSSVRANILSGRIALKSQKYNDAINAFCKLVRRDSWLFAEVLSDVEWSFEQVNDRVGFIALLKEAYHHGGGPVVLFKLAEMIEQQDGDQAATEFLLKALERTPSLKGISQLLNLKLPHVNGDMQPFLQQLKNTTDQLKASENKYLCEQCGFSANKLHWQCPSCKEWDSIKPSHVSSSHLNRCMSEVRV